MKVFKWKVFIHGWRNAVWFISLEWGTYQRLLQSSGAARLQWLNKLYKSKMLIVLRSLLSEARNSAARPIVRALGISSPGPEKEQWNESSRPRLINKFFAMNLWRKKKKTWVGWNVITMLIFINEASGAWVWDSFLMSHIMSVLICGSGGESKCE